MKVTRHDDGTYSITGIAVEDLERFAALADFPVWSAQPKEIGVFCAALHDGVWDAMGDDRPDGNRYLSAEAVGMIAETTIWTE